MAGLDRFKSAQDGSGSGFEAALGEIRRGRKRGHWIWYVFPQLSGLGMSSMSRFYGIAGEAEAMAYLGDEVLRTRLLTITAAVVDQLQNHAIGVRDLMGGDTDARKLVSSLTLFGHVAGRLYAAERLDAYRQLQEAAEAVLAIAAGQGYPACDYTRRQLSH